MKCCRSTWNQQNNCSIHFRACLGMDFGFMLDLEYADFHKTLESDRPPKNDNHNKQLLRCKWFWRELIVHILETIFGKNANVTQSRKNSEAMPRSNSFCCGWGGSPVSCGDTQIIPGHKSQSVCLLQLIKQNGLTLGELGTGNVPVQSKGLFGTVSWLNVGYRMAQYPTGVSSATIAPWSLLCQPTQNNNNGDLHELNLGFTKASAEMPSSIAKSDCPSWQHQTPLNAAKAWNFRRGTLSFCPPFVLNFTTYILLWILDLLYRQIMTDSNGHEDSIQYTAR